MKKVHSQKPDAADAGEEHHGKKRRDAGFVDPPDHAVRRSRQNPGQQRPEDVLGREKAGTFDGRRRLLDLSPVREENERRQRANERKRQPRREFLPKQEKAEDRRPEDLTGPERGGRQAHPDHFKPLLLENVPDELQSERHDEENAEVLPGRERRFPFQKKPRKNDHPDQAGKPLPDPDDQHRIHLRPRELPHANARHEVEDHRKKREQKKPA